MSTKPTHATLSILFQAAIKENKGDIMRATFSFDPEILHETFEVGYGGVEDDKFNRATCWCGAYIYIAVVYEGRIEIVSALRNPPI